MIDNDDNELMTLEIIHHYVEVLDRYFGNVSEPLHPCVDGGMCTGSFMRDTHPHTNKHAHTHTRTHSYVDAHTI